MARDFAVSEGVTELTENHWKVINYLKRNYYTQFGIAPMIRKLCKETGFKLNEIYQMFPSGPAKGACKLAGLPKPTGCVLSEGDADRLVRAGSSPGPAFQSVNRRIIWNAESP